MDPGRGRSRRRRAAAGRRPGLDLVGAQHVELVEGVAGVVEQVRVGRRRDGLAVVRLERVLDVLGVVAEVEHERVRP